MKSHIIDIPVDYNDNKERRRTHPLILPNIGICTVSSRDKEVLKKVAIEKTTGDTKVVRFVPGIVTTTSHICHYIKLSSCY